ncbi:MAG: sodium-dependent transporter [Nitrospirae bacterium]|nr:sodium-dependent transporter [Nitrospirota bacterium]
MKNISPRDQWKTKIGLVLAMAGNAIGLGNFLRFPGKAAANGGGAFMIPYFIALIIMAIPIMWLEWAQGRFGGMRGHGTTPGMFHVIWKNPIAKYLGVLGIFIPTIIVIYYTYIGSWTLGFGIYILLNEFPKVDQSVLNNGLSTPQIAETILRPFDEFRISYTGKPCGEFLQVQFFTYFIFIAVLLLSLWILVRGVSKGIEILAKVAMPMLFLIAIVLVIRVFTLGHPVSGEFGPMDGFSFLWEPKWFIERDGRQIFVLLDPYIWLEAAGQVFFTLSLGFGAIQCYASYISKNDDVVLTGLATTSANEFAEVILGGSLTIPAAAAFFGVSSAQIIASQGSFYLGFTSMPAIFSFLPVGNVLGSLWFILLFLAALTSVVAMAQPMMAFLEDEIKLTRRQAAILLGLFWFLSSHIPIFLRGGWQVMDFWAGTFGPPLLAFVEVILMMWLFGADKTWKEIHRGAVMKVPRFFYYTAKYITPVFLGIIFSTWIYQNIASPFFKGNTSQIALEGVEMGWAVWVTRLFLITIFIGLCFIIFLVWRKREILE